MYYEAADRAGWTLSTQVKRKFENKAKIECLNLFFYVFTYPPFSSYNITRKFLDFRDTVNSIGDWVNAKTHVVHALKYGG